MPTRLPRGFGLKPPGFLAENVDVCFGVFVILVGLGLIIAATKIIAAVVMGAGFLIVGVALLIKEREFLKEVVNRSERKNVLLTIGVCLVMIGVLSSIEFEPYSIGQKIGFLLMIAGLIVIFSSEILQRRK